MGYLCSSNHYTKIPNLFYIFLYEECQCLLNERAHAKLVAEMQLYVMLNSRGRMDLLHM